MDQVVGICIIERKDRVMLDVEKPKEENIVHNVDKLIMF